MFVDTGLVAADGCFFENAVWPLSFWGEGLTVCLAQDWGGLGLGCYDY